MNAFDIKVRSGGATLDRVYQVVALDIVKELDRIPDATLILAERRGPRGEFVLSELDLFAPGKELEIAANWIGEPETRLFVGRVVRHAVRFDGRGPVLRVELRGAALRLTRPRRSRTFVQRKDAQVFAQLVEEAGLTLGKVADTEVTHPLLLQYRASDWDFLVSRAQALGLCVLADDDAITLARPALAGPADLRLDLDIDPILDLELESDGREQEAGIAGRAWDPATQALTEAVAATDFTLAQGQPEPAKVAGQLGFARSQLAHTVPLASAELQEWADGLLRRNRLAMLRGRIGLRGRPGVKPLHVVELARVGQRFNGKALISAVRHRFDDTGWRTDLALGLDPARLAARADVADLPAAGLLPPVSGLQIGVVVAAHAQGDTERRIPVALPVLGPEAAPVLARLATPHAGDRHGFVFRPEPHDEVIIGFLADDPRQPVILGALFSSKYPPPGDYAQADQDNRAKGIVTRSGAGLGFVDADQPRIFLRTPAGNQVVLDDEKQHIELKDQHGNHLVMSKDGVSITSGGALKIEGQSIELVASGAVKIKGQSIDLA